MTPRISKFQVISVAATVMSALCVYAVLAVLPARPAVELSAVSGKLAVCDVGYCVGEGPVFFGPDWYLEQTQSDYDYNGDGVTGTLFEELSGILGERAIVEVDPSTEQPSAYVVNGAPWLEFEESPPWSGDTTAAPSPTPDAAGEEATSDDTEPEVESQLAVLTGHLERCGNGFCLDQLPLHLGPWWFLNHTVAAHDYDRDGDLTSPAGELEALLGTEVHIEALPDDEGHVVINLNGLSWRPVDKPPPWAAGPTDEVIASGEDDAEEESLDDDSDGPPEDRPGPPGP